MSIPFSQTLESQRFNSNYLIMPGMLISFIMAVLWGIWFFTSPVIIYETSQNISIADKVISRKSFSGTESGTRRAHSFKIREITAKFPGKSLKHIKKKQQAYFFPENKTGNKPKNKIGNQTGVVPASVIKIMPDSSDFGNVILKTKYRADLPDPFKECTGGTIRIAARQTTPARILTRTSGFKKNTGPVTLSPRKVAP